MTPSCSSSAASFETFPPSAGSIASTNRSSPPSSARAARSGRPASRSNTQAIKTPPCTGASFERNLRLLLLEDQERPGDAFTLMNLGWAYKDLGQVPTALEYYERSLAPLRPGSRSCRSSTG